MPVVPLLAHFYEWAGTMRTSTFGELLNEYLFGGYIPAGYWRRYRERLWLHHGLKPYPGLRARVLAKQIKRSKFQQKQQFKAMLSGPSIFEKLGIRKDDSWTGGHLVVPFGNK